MPVTIGQSLQTGALRHCKLVAGKAGLHRSIRYVDSMEIPNISPWLKQDELLVTTGYAIKNDLQALPDLISSLARVGAAGLAVKTRFLGEVDRQAIQLADRLEIPVIEIPPDLGFIDIITPLMKEILDDQNSQLEFSQLVNDRFIQLELDGGSFDDIAQTLSELVSRPVFITDKDLRVLAERDLRPAMRDLVMHAAEQGVQVSPHYTIRPTERATETVLDGEGLPRLLCHSAVVKKQTRGYVFLVCLDAMPDEAHRIALSHAATSVALEFSKLQTLEDNNRLMDNNLLVDLLTSNISSPKEAEYRARTLLWPNLPLRLAVANIDHFERISQRMNESEVLQLKKDIAKGIRTGLARQDVRCKVIHESDNFTCLLPDIFSREELSALFSDVAQTVAGQHGIGITVGIAHAVTRYIDIPDRYSEARDTIAITRAMYAGRAVMGIEEVQLDQALFHVREHAGFVRFAEQMLEPLARHDRENDTRFLLTLEALVANLGARNRTAEDLYLHRNTLANWIRKIEELSGLDLSDGGQLVDVGVALRLWKLRQMDRLQ